MPTLPGTNFCGPFNRMDKATRNDLDRACKEHDIGYVVIGNKAYFYNNQADRKFLSEVKAMINNQKAFGFNPKDIKDFYNKKIALAYFTFKQAIAPSMEDDKSMSVDYDDFEDVPSRMPGNKRIRPPSEYDTESEGGSVQHHQRTRHNNSEEDASSMSYEDDFRKNGTPDCVGNYKFTDNLSPHVDKPHATKELTYGQINSNFDQCAITNEQFCTWSQYLTNYLDQVPSIVARYAAFGAGPADFVVQNVDMTAGAVPYIGTPNTKLKGAMRASVLTKYKNNGECTAYIEFGLYKSTDGVTVGDDDLLPSLEHKLAAKLLAANDGTYTFRNSLMHNLLAIDNSGQYKKVKGNRILLKPGQYVYVTIDIMVKGNPFDPKHYSNSVRNRYTKGDYHFATRVYGDVGSELDFGAKVGTMRAQIDFCRWTTKTYSVKVPDDKKSDYTQQLAQQATSSSLYNKNVDQPSTAVGG